jgi:AraC-like DNA-binding protein
MISAMNGDKRELLKFFGTRPLEFTLGFRHLVAENEFCPFHSHSAFEIVYHPRGRGTTLLRNGQRIDFEEGGAVIYPPYMEHDQKLFTAGEDVCIQTGHEGPLPAPLREGLYVPPIEDAQLKSELQSLGSARAARSPLGKAALAHRVTALMISLLELCPASSRREKESSADQYAEAARQFIKDRIQDIGRIEEVAQRVGVSHDYLRHIFKERMGMSLAAWLNHCRVERAKELLAHTPLPLKAIAGSCGFENERYFCFVFKKHERCRPGEFRKSHR